jgi:hypothetical protein
VCVCVCACDRYVVQRKENGASPSFYLDVATYFFQQPATRKMAERVLSAIADLGIDDPQLLRIVGYKLFNEGLLRPAARLFEKVLALRKNEPQSFRDLVRSRIAVRREVAFAEATGACVSVCACDRDW